MRLITDSKDDFFHANLFKYFSKLHEIDIHFDKSFNLMGDNGLIGEFNNGLRARESEGSKTSTVASDKDKSFHGMRLSSVKSGKFWIKKKNLYQANLN